MRDLDDTALLTRCLRRTRRGKGSAVCESARVSAPVWVYFTRVYTSCNGCLRSLNRSESACHWQMCRYRQPTVKRALGVPSFCIAQHECVRNPPQAILQSISIDISTSEDPPVLLRSVVDMPLNGATIGSAMRAQASLLGAHSHSSSASR